MKKSPILHPFLLGIFPILFLFSYNLEQVPKDEMIKGFVIAIAITSLFTLVAWLSLYFILKDKKKAGLTVSLFLILFFSYGHFYYALIDLLTKLMSKTSFDVGSITIKLHMILFSLWCVFLLLGIYFLIKTRKNLHNLTNFLNITGSLLVLFSLVNIGVYGLDTMAYRRGSETMKDEKADIIDSGNSGMLPDIYYIIVDGYTRQDVLKELYDYDNSEFTDYLAGKGFYIASKSRSNYAFTETSLASSLNMEYFNNTFNTMPESKKLDITFQMMGDNRVMRFLKKRGYRFVVLVPRFAEIFKDNADLLLEGYNFNEFIAILISTTMLAPCDSFITRKFMKGYPMRMLTTLRTFSALAEAPKIRGPKLVFAYFSIPAAPFIFNANGEPAQVGPISESGSQRIRARAGVSILAYINQITFVNKKIKESIDMILSGSRLRPVIILQADHGPEYVTRGKWPDILRERTSIFNAYYVSDNIKEFLYDSITPVNTFRLIFSRYFGADYDLLDDKCYYSTLLHFFDFIDVTDKVEDD